MALHSKVYMYTGRYSTNEGIHMRKKGVKLDGEMLRIWGEVCDFFFKIRCSGKVPLWGGFTEM